MSKTILINSKYIQEYGQYYWFIIHFEALKIMIHQFNSNNDKKSTDKLISDYLDMVSYLIENMLCSCKNHAKRILIKNPFWKSDLNIFQWTVLFHNSVNKRLNKSIISYLDAFNHFSKYLERESK